MSDDVELADSALLLRDFQSDTTNNRDSIACLYKQHVVMLRVVLKRMDCTLSSQDCEDLSHQVFVELWRNRSVFRGECSVPYYLIRIASNLLGKHRRSEVRRRRLEVQKHLIMSEAEDDALLQKREAEELVNYALKQLPDILRVAVDLVFLQRRTIAEAAKIAQCSIHAMESRYRRGKQHVEKQLKHFF